MKRKQNIVICLLFVVFLAGFGLWMNIKTPDTYSDSERRVLSKDKTFSIEEFWNGKFMTKFEDYALDQIPFRETMRRVKAVAERGIFQKKDSNEIYYVDGYLSKLEYPMNQKKVEYACDRIDKVYDTYLKEQGITPYLVVVPDKNYYLADSNGYLSMDYDTLYEKLYADLSYMNPIEIRDILSLKDYYYTDTHWRQERIVDVAQKIGAAMGTPVQAEYEVVRLDSPFNGVYVGQAALPVKPDTQCYLTNEMLKKCTVTSYDSGSPVDKPMYNLDKSTGKDPYEMYLNGAAAVLTIENPNATTDKELVIFRDSFGSSLAPLLADGYQKITLIDLRYIQSDYVGSFVTFTNQEVLFEYSTLLINQGLGGGN